MTVLVVNDEDGPRERMTRALASFGTVHVAASVQDARRAIEQGDLTCAILDVVLRGPHEGDHHGPWGYLLACRARALDDPPAAILASTQARTLQHVDCLHMPGWDPAAAARALTHLLDGRLPPAIQRSGGCLQDWLRQARHPTANKAILAQQLYSLEVVGSLTVASDAVDRAVDAVARAAPSQGNRWVAAVDGLESVLFG